MISLKNKNKAEVLAKLFNASKSQGMSFLSLTGEKMTIEKAQSILDSGQTYFDYLEGKVMKVDLSGEEFDPWLYDRDNGQGAAERAINQNKD